MRADERIDTPTSRHGALLHGLVEQVVRRHPDRIAVSYGNDVVRYSELDDRSNRISASLLARGVTVDDIVAISMQKSIEMIVAILGTLKAGAAYLPVDVTYPESRKAHMLSDSKARYVVTTERHEQAIPGIATPLCIEACLSERPTAPATRRVEIADRNLAYVIYTSGSTGTPQGVAIEHKSIVNTIAWRNDYYRFSPSDRILQVPSFSFDSSVEDIFCCLSSGAQLVLLDEQDKLNPVSLRRILSTHRITHMLVTPTYYKAILNETYPSMPTMKAITIAGEAFDGSLVAQHLSKLPHVKLINEYGPTENSVCSTAYELKDTEVLIGKPIPNVRCHVLDGDLMEVEPGEEGELYIGGIGLARGYLGNRELTERRFVRRPHAEHEVLFRTGDLVVRTRAGDLKFLGRIDRQVKVRGFRVELAEIERVLQEHELVRDAVVTAHKGPDTHQINAYLIPRDADLDRDRIRAYLKDKLPDYMVPSHMFEVSEFPTLPNGKLDVDRLTEVGMRRIGRSENGTPVRHGDVAAIVVSMVAKHTELGHERLAECLHDDLKDLGMDSLNLLTLLIDLQSRFDIEFDFDALEDMSIVSIDKIASIVSRLLGVRTRMA